MDCEVSGHIESSASQYKQMKVDEYMVSPLHPWSWEHTSGMFLDESKSSQTASEKKHS